MPYLLYRMDVSRPEFDKAEPVRFRAFILSDKMNIMDEIDLTAKLSGEHLPSPHFMDQNWIAPEELEKGDLCHADFMHELRDWIDFQMEKRRGKLVFVPARGADTDQAALEAMIDKHGDGYQIASISDYGRLDIQALATEIGNLEKLPFPANDDGYHSDMLAITMQLRPAQFLPFHMESNIPGDKNIPAFMGGYETLKYAVQNHPKLLKEMSAEPNFEIGYEAETLSEAYNLKSFGGNDLVALQAGDQTAYKLVTQIVDIEGEKHAILLDLDQDIPWQVRRRSQKNLVQDLMTGKGGFSVIPLRALPKLARRTKSKIAKTDQAKLEARLKELDKNKAFRNKMAKVALDYCSLQKEFSQKSKKPKKILSMDTLSSNLRAAAWLHILDKDRDAHDIHDVFTFEAAQKEVEEFNDLPGDTTAYQYRWSQYLEKRREALKGKAQSLKLV